MGTYGLTCGFAIAAKNRAARRQGLEAIERAQQEREDVERWRKCDGHEFGDIIAPRNKRVKQFSPHRICAKCGFKTYDLEG